MKNNITNHYIARLTVYTQQNECRYREPALLFIEQLDKIQSIETLQQAMEDTLNSIPAFQNQSPSLSSPQPYTFFDEIFEARKDVFYKLLLEIQKEIELRKSFYLKSKLVLTNIAIVPQTEHLIALIKELLDDPRSLVHDRILSFLKGLQEIEPFQGVLDHLARQPITPRATNINPGDFNAIIPQNEQHATCLILLRNNSAKFDDRNVHSSRANDLLQALLIIYSEIQAPPEKATRPKTRSPSESNSTCIVL